MDIQKVDKTAQTSLVTGSSIRGITTTETESVSAVPNSQAASSNTVDSLALPFFRLGKSHRKYSISKVDFSKRKTKFYRD